MDWFTVDALNPYHTYLESAGIKQNQPESKFQAKFGWEFQICKNATRLLECSWKI